MIRAGRVVVPAIRWDPEGGFAAAAETIEAARALGVGGFIVFGGPAAEVRTLVADLQVRSPAPLLIGADLERGAGQQFHGATALPPAAALGALDDVATTRRAGEVTGREARALGVNWVYAPVADLDVEPANPIVGSRAYGADPARVAAHVTAWVEGCQAAGALACVKHFPGHGRTTADSHLELPAVAAPRAALEADLTPFRAAVSAGVASVMTAHVAYPALDPRADPATLSPAIVADLLRQGLGFSGLVVTDALVMAGAQGATAGDEARAAVLALAAGCDVILCPSDPAAVVAAIECAPEQALPRPRLAEAVARVDAAAARVSGRPGGDWGRAEDRDWALATATAALRVARGRPEIAGTEVDVLTVDDDAGGPFPPPPRTALPAALAAAGMRVRESVAIVPDRPAIVAVYADIRGWKGRPGLSAAARERVRQAVAARPGASVILFGHPRLAGEVPGTAVLVAWGGEPIMQEAVGRWLAGAGSRR